MNDVRVKGFYDITFWQDSGIGLIVLRSDEKGMVKSNAVAELVTALGTASFDDNVKAVALTGMNNNFCTGIKGDEIDRKSFEELFEYTNSLISLIYSLEKPIFSLLSGDAMDAGYEIALLGDELISAEDVKVGYNSGHTFMLGGSITTPKFRSGMNLGNADEGKNVDRVLPRDTFLDDAKKYILEHQGFDYHLMRRRLMRNMRESLLEEKDNFLRRTSFS